MSLACPLDPTSHYLTGEEENERGCKAVRQRHSPKGCSEFVANAETELMKVFHATERLGQTERHLLLLQVHIGLRSRHRAEAFKQDILRSSMD